MRLRDHGGNPSPAPHRLLPAWKSPDVLDVGRAVDLLQAPQHIAGVKGPGDAAGAAGVNMAGPGVEAVIVLRRALAPLASWNPVRWLKAIRFTLRFHRGSRVRTGILPPCSGMTWPSCRWKLSPRRPVTSERETGAGPISDVP